MTTFELQKLRDLPIEGVAERLGLRVERHKCLCPFHDDHKPSLTFKGNRFKCWSLLSAGHKAIAIPSATLLTREVVEQLSGLNSSPHGEAGRGLFHMFPDRDAPGERLFLQLKEVLPDLVHHQLPLGCKDFSEYYVQIQNSKLINSK
jgi:hypothetical protein